MILMSGKGKIFIAVVVAWLVYTKLFRKKQKRREGEKNPVKKGKGRVDKLFLKRINKLLKIVFPRLMCQQTVCMLVLSVSLVMRTLMSIRLAEIQGKVVKSIIERNGRKFLRQITVLFLFSLPSSAVNSMLDYLNKKMGILFRRELNGYFNKKYLKNIVFYQISNMDERIQNPDQRLTDDILKWSDCLAQLYSNISKPILDIIMFSRKLSQSVGWEGPGIVIGWYFIAGFLMKAVAPPFGKMMATAQMNEGEYRSHHFDILSHSEEIAFYNGGNWENQRVHKSFSGLIQHAKNIIYKRFFMGIADSILIKYGAFVLGYVVVGLPVFGPRREEYLRKVGNDSSKIVKDYVQNTGLLINLAKGIGRIIISYKEIQNLAGYTSLVCDFNQVLDDMKISKYERTLIDESLVSQQGTTQIDDKKLKFDKVPLVTPNGELLIKEVNFEIDEGMCLFVDGPNGSGKTSIFRLLGGLWPVYGGEMTAPSSRQLFIIPQTAYLPAGNLRDQIIYPDSKIDMLKKGVTDKDMQHLLDLVELTVLIDRWGFDHEQPWHDIFSGGQRQRVAIARCFYHQPKFAVLDECTSGVSVDVEPKIYSTAKELGITLITCSHRPNLKKYCDYLLKLDGQGNYNFGKMLKDEVSQEEVDDAQQASASKSPKPKKGKGRKKKKS